MPYFLRPASVFIPSVATAVFLSWLAVPASAQEPAHLAFADGGVSLAREDDLLDAEAGQPLVAGDRLRTTAGRAEVWFPDGSTLVLDAHTSVEWRSPAALLLTEGRIALTVAPDRGDRRAAETPYRIETPSGTAIVREPGDYRVALVSDRAEELVELSVVRGSADLQGDGGSVAVRAGERSIVKLGSVPSYPQVALTTRIDAFERWVLARRDSRLRRPAAARHLPENLQMYGSAFDQYGAWEPESTYGYVWYPRVAADWRPYYNGYWSPISAFGWTWIGHDAWGWPTHHYGRWGFARSRWFWIPDRHWGPAWVSWAGAPGYVSWCPLGFDNRPVFSLAVGGGSWGNGWVVLPHASFGRRSHYVHRYALDASRVPHNLRFAPGRAPEWAGFARGSRRDAFRNGQAVPRGDHVAATRAQQWPSAPTRAPFAGGSGDTAVRRDWRSSGDTREVAGRYARPRAPEHRTPRPESPKVEHWQTRGLPQSEWRTEREAGRPSPFGADRRWSTGDRSGAWSSDRAVPRLANPVQPSTSTPVPGLPPRTDGRSTDHPAYRPYPYGGPSYRPRGGYVPGGAPGGPPSSDVSAPREFRMRDGGMAVPRGFGGRAEGVSGVHGGSPARGRDSSGGNAPSGGASGPTPPGGGAASGGHRRSR